MFKTRMMLLNKLNFIEKFKVTILFGLALAFLNFIPSSAPKAQEGVNLEDYLQSEQPDSSTLSDPNQQPTVPAQTLQDVQSSDNTPTANVPSQQVGVVETQGNQQDAMPPVTNTRLRIETEGFDYAPEKDITAEFQLGGQDINTKSQAELQEEIRQEAFDAAITGLFPLRPEDIKSLLKEYDKTTRAVEEPVYGTPTPRVNVETISLDPGVAPMTVHTATGHITTLNILDGTGAPWPIQDISWAGDFEVIEPEEGGHIIRITPMAVAAYGNMSIRLLTLKTPITIMLKTGTDEVQYRVDVRVPEFGPFAKAPLIEGGSSRVAGNSLLMSILDGVPPDAAEKLNVSGVDGRTTAYKIRGNTYVRTPLTLLSPGWQQSVSSADGMHVYAMADTPVLLLSDGGRFTRANLSPGRNLFE